MFCHNFLILFVRVPYCEVLYINCLFSCQHLIHFNEKLAKCLIILLSGNIGGTALSRLGFSGEVAISVSTIIGAVSVMMIIIVISQRVQSHVILLIIGVMTGYIATAVIGVLKFFSNDEDVRAYVIGGLGSFSKVSGNQVYTFVCLMIVLIPLSFLFIKTQTRNK
jgi:iron complex transport system permease protein